MIERRSAGPGIRNLVVMRGAARRPDGDVVQFDLLTRFANPVLRELRALSLGDLGSAVVGSVCCLDRDPAAFRLFLGHPEA